MQTCGAGKCSPTEGHRAAPNKIEVQILRHKKNAYWVASHCLPQLGENAIPHSLSYTFPNHVGKRRKSNPKPLVLSEARKQLMIYRLPQVLRLHLKRFRWACSRASHVAVNCRNRCFKGKWWGQMSLLLGGDAGSLGTLCFPWWLNESCPVRQDVGAQQDWAAALMAPFNWLTCTRCLCLKVF